MTDAGREPLVRAPTASPRDFLATFVVLFGLIVALLLLDLFLARIARNEAQQHAANVYEEGRALLASGQPGEAADRLSTAVSLERTNVAYALALAQATLAEGRADDAEQMLNALLERAPNDGALNLTMARLLAMTARARDAKAFYHRAIYGRWAADSTPQRIAARFELIDLLVREHAHVELLAELLPLQSDSADSTMLLKRLGPLYLRAGSPSRAAEAFRALIRRSPSDPAAYVALGDALLALGQFQTARAVLRNGARAIPGDRAIVRQLRLVDSVVALDPMARGLRDAERLRRSRWLLARTLAVTDSCAPANSVSDGERDSARVELHTARPRTDLATSAERNLALAAALWRVRPAACVTDSLASAGVGVGMVTLLQRALAH